MQCKVQSVHRAKWAEQCSVQSGRSVQCTECELQRGVQTWLHLNVWPVSAKPGPAPHYAIHCNMLQFDPLPECSSAFQARVEEAKAVQGLRHFLRPPLWQRCVFKENQKCFCKIQFCLSPLLLLFFLNPVSRFAIDQRPGRFLSIRFLLLFFPTNDPTDEPSPFRAGFQLFALHISPTFASNLKSCSRQILNLFRKNRAPRIFHLSARARVQSSMARLMNLTLKRAKNTGNISSKANYVFDA